VLSGAVRLAGVVSADAVALAQVERLQLVVFVLVAVRS